MGFAAVQVLSGATKLSELAIDIGKDWLAYLIKNLADPVDAQDAATKSYVDAQLAARIVTDSGAISDIDWDVVYPNDTYEMYIVSFAVRNNGAIAHSVIVYEDSENPPVKERSIVSIPAGNYATIVFTFDAYSYLLLTRSSTDVVKVADTFFAAHLYLVAP